MTIATTPRVWGRYLAVGDSLTEGLADPGSDGRFRGWADRLAEALAEVAEHDNREFEYANLGIRGRKLADVVGSQLDVGLSLEPDLVSIWGGGNDCLRPRVEIDELSQAIDDAVERTRATGADVLLPTTVRPKGSPVLSLTTGRCAELTSNIHSIAARHGCYVVDAWGLAALRDRRMWASDRVHLSSLGHQLLARAAYAGLGFPIAAADLEPLEPLPDLPRRDRINADIEWVRSHCAPWVYRRLTRRSSGDGLGPKRPQPSPVQVRLPV